MHQQNVSTVVITTFKYHFIENIFYTDKKCLINVWDMLLPQASIKSNLICLYHINPNISDESKLKSNFDLNKTPPIPPITKVVM